MKLSRFISDLFENGNVTVASELQKFDAKDLDTTTQLLHFHYDRSILEMPFDAPDFHEAAALWGATFIYRTVQFILLRDLDEEKIKIHLIDFPKEKITPEVIYSVDLTFRYLKDLFDLAKGLSPNDPLVKRLKGVAEQWPFSTVGIKLLENTEDEMILENDSLRTAYIDRIIEAKDLKKVKNNKKIEALVAAVLGDHAEEFWKEFFNQSVNVA